MLKNKDYVVIGRILSCFGIKGQVKIFVSPDFKNFIMGNYKKIPLFFDSAQAAKFKLLQEKPNGIYAQIDGVKDRTEAEALGKPFILCKKEDIPELELDEYLYSDLVNLPVYNEENIEIGIVSSVNNFGAGDIIEIKFSNGEIEMFPFRKEIFLEVDNEKLIFRRPEYS